MTRTRLIGLTLLLLYGAFFSWYTSFGGPLSEEEKAVFRERIESRVPAPTPERLAMLVKFMDEDTGDDFVMVNLIDLYDVPRPIEGVAPGASSEAVLDQYMEYMVPALLSRASHPVLYGQAASTALDLMHADGMERWTTGAAMRYRSRRDMLEIATNPEFAGRHAFKEAAMRKTIAFPIDPWFQLGDPRLVLGLSFALIGCGLGSREALRSPE